MSYSERKLETYNIEVDENHNYFVGDDGILVHNASKIDRNLFRREREAYWRAEAMKNPTKYSASDFARMALGKPPIGSDGHPMELHHVNQTQDGGLKPLTRTDHRLGENYKKNHPD